MTHQSTFTSHNPMDYVESTSIFSDMRRIVISKDFKGGMVTNIFGATSLDFTNADIKGIVVLDVTQLFGETKIAVPADWRVETDISVLFGEIKDKRLSGPKNNSKILVLKGTSVMASVAIYDYLKKSAAV